MNRWLNFFRWRRGLSPGKQEILKLVLVACLIAPFLCFCAIGSPSFTGFEVFPQAIGSYIGIRAAITFRGRWRFVGTICAAINLLLLAALVSGAVEALASGEVSWRYVRRFWKNLVL